MTTKDPYELLGLKRDASEDAIRRAYRKLAKVHHPDLNPGNKEAERRFKDINAAHDLLSDPVKRARFDRGEIDGTGAERADAFHRAQGAGRPGGPQSGTPFGDVDIDELFSMFGQGRPRGGGSRGAAFKMPGADRAFTLTVDFLTAVNGGKQRIMLAPDRPLDLTIPPGVEEGQVLRLKGQGEPGFGGGPAGAALITITIAPHKLFRRDGDDIRIDLPVTLGEAVLGARIAVPTRTGPVTVTIPKGSNTGTQLRLKGKGIARGATAGDQYVSLKIMLPERPDPELEAFAQNWSGGTDFDPRAGLAD